MNKEKPKNKIKVKQSKNPLPKIKSNNKESNIKVKSLNNKIIQDSKNNNDLEHLKINYPKEQKQILPKNNIRTNEMALIKNSNAKISNKNNNKLTLRYLLKEYGLSEYCKKMNEIGYNNDNFTDIGTMTKKNFNVLINHINILPFHYEKFEKFYEYLKKLNHSNLPNKKNQTHLQEPVTNSTPLIPKRRFNFNFNSVNNNLNKYGLNNNENTKVNQIYNQYQNYYNKYIEHFNDNINNNNYHLNYELNNNNEVQKRYNRKTLNINRRRKKKSYIKAKSRPRPHTSNPKLYASKNGINKNQLFKIRIRNNYSGKKIMRKKVQHFSLINSPYLNNMSLEDNSSLIRSYFNDYQNMAENHKFNLYNQNRNFVKQSEYQNKLRSSNNDDINRFYKIENNNYALNIEQDDIYSEASDNIERMLNHYMFQLNEKLDKSYESIEDSSLSHIVISQTNENQNQIQNEKIESPNPYPKLIPPSKKIQKNKSEEKIESKLSKQNKDDNNKKVILKNNTNEKMIEEIKKNEGETSKENKKLSDHNTSTKSKESKEQQIEDFEEKKYLTKEEAEKLLSNDIDIDTAIDKKYNLEQNIYETIRLNKSFDEDNSDKETIKFDIEFICRCLGLALMKIIEQGQDKEHITDLYNPLNPKNNKYNFTFLNDDYNKNIFLLEEFFNSDDKNNKLEKGENSKKILGDMNLISVLEQLSMKKNEIDNKDINLIKNLKKTGDEKYLISEDNTDKINNEFIDMDKELRFLGHFFSYKRAKIKDYQGLTENTKKILGKDLSYIKEIDSEINGTASKAVNNSESNISNNNKDDNGALNDSKNNQINMNKILDDSYEYEDEFLKEKCLDDLKDEEEEEKKNIDTNELKSENLININSNDYNNQNEIKEQNIAINKNNNKNLIENNIQISLKKEPEKDVIINTQDIEASYIIDAENIQEFKLFLLSKFDVFDEDYIYISKSIPAKRLMQSPDPQTIFEFCANIMLLTKMEKETIIVALIYIERLIFNTGLLITSRNWRKIIFTSLIIASKIWDDDSLENLHFSQIFTHLKIGEINLLERNFMELINYKIYVKFSEYMKYYLAVKDMCLKYNYDGEKIVKIDPHKIIKIQEYKYQLQKRMNKTLCLNNSASF